MHLLGTHGTCQSRAMQIVENQQFKVSVESVQAGPGIYFWAYEDNFDVAKELAELWWRLCTHRSCYAGDKDKSCAIVGVKISKPSEGAFVDATTTDFRDALAALCELHKDSVDDIYDVYAFFLANIEKETGVEIQVVKALVKTPKRVNGYEQTAIQKLYPSSPAYVVRESGVGLFSEIYKIQ